MELDKEAILKTMIDEIKEQAYESSHEIVHIKNTQMEIAKLKNKQDTKPKFSTNVEHLISKVIK